MAIGLVSAYLSPGEENPKGSSLEGHLWGPPGLIKVTPTPNEGKILSLKEGQISQNALICIDLFKNIFIFMFRAKMMNFVALCYFWNGIGTIDKIIDCNWLQICQYSFKNADFACMQF